MGYFIKSASTDLLQIVADEHNLTMGVGAKILARLRVGGTR